MQYDITEKLWRYPGDAAWYFIRLDQKTSAHLKEFAPKRGWGSVKVQANIGTSTWETSAFPEKEGTYLLPVKAQIRKKETLGHGDTVTVTLSLL